MSYEYNAVLERMQSRFAALAGYAADDASDIGIRLKVLAGEIVNLGTALSWVKTQMFPETATGESLDRHAAQRGITRKAAVPASGALTFTRNRVLSYDVPVPKGTVCATPGLGGVRMVTTEDGVLSQGAISVTVPAATETGGSAGNTAAETVTVMVTPPPGVNDVTNAQPFTGGADAESDEELRKRLMESYRNIPNGTNAAFYRDVALSFEGIYSVGVVPRAEGNGTVALYLAGKGAAPGEELLARVKAELDRLREINVDVTVQPAELVPVKVVVYVSPREGYSMETVRAACKESLARYFASLSIGEPFLLAAAGEAVYHTPGVKNYAFDDYFCADTAMEATQLAVAGEFTVAQQTGGVV